MVECHCWTYYYRNCSLHHRENYIQSLEKKVIPSGLKINKKPAFAPISQDFMIN